jgi:hypothetical protein
MVAVMRRLIARVCVDRGHISRLDPDGFVQNFRHGCQAICRAGRVGHNNIRRRQLITVHTKDNRSIGLRRRGRNQNPFAAVLKMFSRLVAAVKSTGAFQRNVDTVPRQVFGFRRGAV